jgi:hypothetical protein
MTNGREPTEVTVGLLATPPDYPARVAARLADELRGLLTRDSGDTNRWAVRTGWGAVRPPRDRGVEGLLDGVEERRDEEGWDVVVCLTDLPLHAGPVPVVAHLSWERRAAVVALPALGLRQWATVRDIVPGLVVRLASGDRSVPLQRLVDGVTVVHRVVERDGDGEVGLVASRFRGPLRLLAGMVRANRPGRALLGLSKLLVGAFGTAALALTTSTIWKIGDALGAIRLTVIMLLGLGGLVTWLIVAHDLWEKPDDGTPPELARLFNAGTALTLALATGMSYLVLFGTTALAGALLIDPSVLGPELGRHVRWTDYLTMAWIISSLATVGGAIGSGLEDEETVRASAYGYHPDPGGWRDDSG